MAESMQGLHRTCRCAEVTTQMVGSEVTLMGWVQKARDKGGIIFVDLRDRSGLLQIIFEQGDDPQRFVGAEEFAKAESLRSEYVIAVVGKVENREGNTNENMATGAIEAKGETPNEEHVEQLKGMASGMENIAWFFCQVLFIGGAGGLLVQSTLEPLGYKVELVDLAKVEIPVGIFAAVVGIVYYILKDRALRKKYYKSTK